MLRIAKLVADQSEMEALITGESLAQVASQTMQAIACTDAAQNLPILRPLIGMDKTEIIAISRKIGTFDTSIEPYEDCCTIFTPPHPKTKPSLAEIEAAEAGMPGLAELERIAAETVEKIREPEVERLLQKLYSESIVRVENCRLHFIRAPKISQSLRIIQWLTGHTAIQMRMCYLRGQRHGQPVRAGRSAPG